jgi:hypothetical protein
MHGDKHIKMKELISVFRNFANAPKNKYYIHKRIKTRKIQQILLYLV